MASSGYNAGNQFLDALAHYRMTQLSLPALSVSLPAVSEQLSTNTDNFNKLFIDKIYEQQNQTRPVLVYAIKIPPLASTASTSTYARNMILQMRRIQPRGPYQLVAVRNKQEEISAHEMIRQLKDHLMVINVRLLLLDD
ncbi:unnamed protein product [Adineta steineri]|uniref:Uncharacterized protein n=1 Tax=Adineta steineri TaxID=433720 RepID=A0A818XGF4_9BILA|nr:unnamed protein product [Adineta steineri]